MKRKRLLLFYLLFTVLYIIYYGVYKNYGISLSGYYSDVLLFWIWLAATIGMIRLFWPEKGFRIAFYLSLPVLLVAILWNLRFFAEGVMATTPVGYISSFDINNEYKARVERNLPGVRHPESMVKIFRKKGILEKEITKDFAEDFEWAVGEHLIPEEITDIQFISENKEELVLDFFFFENHYPVSFDQSRKVFTQGKVFMGGIHAPEPVDADNDFASEEKEEVDTLQFSVPVEIARYYTGMKGADSVEMLLRYQEEYVEGDCVVRAKDKETPFLLEGSVDYPNFLLTLYPQSEEDIGDSNGKEAGQMGLTMEETQLHGIWTEEVSGKKQTVRFHSVEEQKGGFPAEIFDFEAFVYYDTEQETYVLERMVVYAEGVLAQNLLIRESIGGGVNNFKLLLRDLNEDGFFDCQLYGGISRNYLYDPEEYDFIAE